MKQTARVLILLAALALCAFVMERSVSGQGGSLLYLPLTDRVIPPQRLGPNVAPGGLAFVFDPSSNGTLYAGLYGGGVFKSTNGGSAWYPASIGLPNNAQVQSMAIDPAHPQRVYAGLYYNDDPAWVSGVYRSEDGGLSWTATGRLDNSLAGSSSNHVVVYALATSADGTTIYAGTRTKIPNATTYGFGGVFKSANYGASWSLVNTGLPQDDLYVYALSVDASNANIVYAGLHGHGAYKTINGGASWESKGEGIAQDTMFTTGQRSVAVNANNSSQVLFGTIDRNSYRSKNAAATWDRTSPGSIWEIHADPSQANAVYISTLNGSLKSLFYSSDFGDHFSLRLNGLPSPYFNVDPFNTSHLVAGGAAGYTSVYQSTDGGTSFSLATDGLTAYPVSGVAVDPGSASRIFIAVFGRGVLVSSDRGATWSDVNSGLPSVNIQTLAMDPSNSNILYALTYANGVYKTTNGGSSWSAVGSSYPTAFVSLNRSLDLPYHPIGTPEPPTGPLAEDESTLSLNAASPVVGLSGAVSPNGSRVLVGTAGRGLVYLNGSTWTASNVSAGSVYALLFDASVAGKVWLGGDSSAGTLQVSTDYGQSWSAAATGLSGRTVYSLARLSSGFMLAGTDAGVFASTDGHTWTLAGLSAETVKAVGVSPTQTGHLLAGTANAVYLSVNNGSSWVDLDSSLDRMSALSMATTPANTDLFFMGTRYGGLILITQ